MIRCPLVSAVALAASSLVSSGVLQASVLEEVVVTAQKRAQSLQDVGIAVTAFSGNQLEQLGYDNAQQITAMSPGVTTIQPNGPSSFFTSIRGVGQNDFSGDHQESPVAVYIDEAYVSAASGAGFQLFDMERVEILRGPQGTLFGRNATGGLVHYISRKPSQENDGYVDITYGDNQQIKIEGAVGGALTDTVSGRVSFLRNKHDPYIKNRVGKDLNNGNDWAVRGQLLFEFDKVEWLLSAKAGKQDIDSGFFKHSSARVNPVTGLGEASNGADLQDLGDSLVPAFTENNSDVHSGAYNVIGHNNVETQGFSSNIKWEFENFDVVSITDFQSLEKDYLEDSDASPNDFFSFFLQSDLDQWSQEIRVSGETDSFRWVTGAYYLNIEGDFANGGIAANFFRAAFAGAGLDDSSLDTLGLYSPFKTETKSTAFFGQLEFDINDELTMHAGLRWSNEDKSSDFKQYASLFSATDNSTVATLDGLGLGGPLFTFSPSLVSNDPGGTGFGEALVTGNPNDATIDKNLITAKLQLDWKPNDDTLIYTSYNRGIKAGGFNAPLDATLFYNGSRPTSDMKFDEEVLDAYEVGFKWSNEDSSLRINGAAYYYDYQDYQAFALESLTTYVFNTDASVKGAEIEIFSSPLEGLDLMFGAGFIDNNVEDAYVQPNGEAVDRRAVLTPEWNLNGLIRYEWPVAAGKVAMQLDATYMDDHHFQLKNSPVGKEDAYVLSNARVSYTSEDESWRVEAFVNNLTDEEYRTMAFDLSGEPAVGGFGLVENYYGLPRWWGVSLNYAWGN